MLDFVTRVKAEDFASLPADQYLARLRIAIDGPIVFTHGLGVEGQLIFHWICEHELDIDVVTLDTGRLFPETYELWAETERRYSRRIRAVYPNTKALERLVGFDTSRGLLKFNPLHDWTREAVLSELRRHDIPINSQHAKGFASIGCTPCTRAFRPGEPERNGRWWWESDDARGCGLHLPKVAARQMPIARVENTLAIAPRPGTAQPTGVVADHAAYRGSISQVRHGFNLYGPRSRYRHSRDGRRQ